MSIGLLASASEAKDKDDKTRKIFDCAICMNEIDVPVVSKAEGPRGAAWLEQRNYMVTPCRHIFHAECLGGLDEFEVGMSGMPGVVATIMRRYCPTVLLNITPFQIFPPRPIRSARNASCSTPAFTT